MLERFLSGSRLRRAAALGAPTESTRVRPFDHLCATILTSKYPQSSTLLRLQRILFWSWNRICSNTSSIRRKFLSNLVRSQRSCKLPEPSIVSRRLIWRLSIGTQTISALSTNMEAVQPMEVSKIKLPLPKRDRSSHVLL